MPGPLRVDVYSTLNHHHHTVLVAASTNPMADTVSNELTVVPETVSVKQKKKRQKRDKKAINEARRLRYAE